MFENEHALTTTKKLLLGSGIFSQLISVVILTVINWQASADVDLKLDLFNSYDLELGTGEDVDAMVQILATFSTCYNWLVTFGVSFGVLAHLKMASKNGEVKKRSTDRTRANITRGLNIIYPVFSINRGLYYRKNDKN